MNWLLLLSTPILIVIQQMSAKVANVTKSDLATLLRTSFGGRVATPAVLLMVAANVITMGADLLAMGAAFELLTGIKFIFWVVPLAAVMAFVTIFTDYKVLSKYLLWLVAVFSAYIVAALLSRPNWGDVLRSTVVPQVSLSPDYLIGAVGLLGTTITPYLFFWQASGEVEEKRGVQGISRRNVDITTGMIWSNITAFSIIVATGAVLFSHHTRRSRPQPMQRAPSSLSPASMQRCCSPSASSVPVCSQSLCSPLWRHSVSRAWPVGVEVWAAMPGMRLSSTS